MKRHYVKLSVKGLWHVDTKTIYTMCGRTMGYYEGPPYTQRIPWKEIAEKPSGPVCKTCLRSLAAWEKRFSAE